MNRRLSRPLALIVAGWFLSFLLAFSGQAQPPQPSPSQAEAARQEKQGIAAYQANQFELAVQAWQEAARAYQHQGDEIARARISSNLALAYQQLGRWPEAEGAIDDSLQLLEAVSPTPPRALGQVLTNQGTLQYAKGQAGAALLTWQKAEAAYGEVEDSAGILRSQLNQAQALQALGLYPRACQRLVQSLALPAAICQEPSPATQEALSAALQRLSPPLNPMQATGWRNLGEVLLALGQLPAAEQVLTAIAAHLPAGEERATVLLSLGNLALAKEALPAATAFYQEAAAIAPTPATCLQSQLAQLKLSILSQEWERGLSLLPSLEENLAQLPASHQKVTAQINFVQQLIDFRQAGIRMAAPWQSRLPNNQEMAAILESARQQAQKLGDIPAESYALGSLGLVAEKASQWQAAQQWTEQALLLAQASKAPEITYRWQWQLGRILAARGEREQAIWAYSEAIATIESIRGDLVANRELGFSFQENVEPAYRQLVSLLLQPDSQGEVPQENLRRARDVMEALQQAELVNFFRQDCLEAKPIAIDAIDARSAVFHTILLPDRLAVILSLPGQPLRYYSTPVAAEEVEAAAAQMRYQMVIRSKRGFFAPARQLYDWLVAPAAEVLAGSGSQTLVFVLDGSLRNIPMPALYDGNRYLLEQYAIALTPGLQLLDPRPLSQKGVRALAAGLQEPRQGFSPLYYVGQELKAISEEVPSAVLFNQQFTTSALADALSASPFPIVHIATHGQFSSDIDQTFILTWDGTVNLRQLDQLLQVRNLSGQGTLELLVLSACETAVGDRRAALGLAGTAVQSGARSTLATLWPVNDEAATELMRSFYSALSARQLTKAQALRQAQLTLLKRKKYQHPFYWGPYILLGNWL